MGRVTDNNKLDIFKITMLAFMPKQWVYKGSVTDSVSHDHLKVNFTVTDKATGSKIPTGPDSVSGSYSMKLPAGHQYTVRMSAKGYRDYVQDVTIPDSSLYAMKAQNITLAKLADLHHGMNDSACSQWQLLWNVLREW